MTLQQLQYVVALDTYRNFVKAADHTFVTQPTLTMQVKKLEEEIGTVIFNRNKIPLEPTRLGEKIIEKARKVLFEANQLRELIKAEREEVTGNFKLGIIPTIAPYLLPLFLKSFVEKFPGAHFTLEEMQSEEIILKLKKEKLDVGILATPLGEKDLREIPMYYEPFLVYVSKGHALFEATEIEESQLGKDGLWLLNQGHCFRNQTLNICQQSAENSAKSSFSYESGSIEALKNMVKSNMGYTLVPELSVLHELESPFVKRITGQQPVREVSLVVHNSFPKALFLNELKNQILEFIPDRFVKNTKVLKIKWR
jgi:LysR family transcriptional regulator, hydrogen peroxide-inducible genes activator